MLLYKRILSLILLIGIVLSVPAQINRTVDTKVADLLAQMPAGNAMYRDKLMNEMLMLGNEGRETICLQIIEPGTGDDTKARFAVESYSKYLSTALDKKEPADWEVLLVEMIEKSSSAEVKAFFIRQLEFVGTDYCIEPLSRFLQDEVLITPAIKSMLLSDAAKSTSYFAQALDNAKRLQQLELVKAIGASGEKTYSNKLIALFDQANDTLKQILLDALACTTDEAAGTFIFAKAKAAGFNPDTTGAVFALLKYCELASASDNVKISKWVITIQKKTTSVQVRTNAMLLLSRINELPAKNTILVKALNSKEKSHRVAAIEEAIRLNLPVEPWVKKLNSSKSEEVQKEILYFLSQVNDKNHLSSVEPLLKSKDGGVRAEALVCYAMLGDEAVSEAVLSFMANSTEQSDFKAAHKALLLCIGTSSIDQTLLLFDKMPEQGKVVLMDIWGARQYKPAFEVLMEQIGDGTTECKVVAMKNLASVSSASDMRVLLNQFNTTNDKTDRNYIAAAVEKIYQESDNIEQANLLIYEASSKGDIMGYISLFKTIGDKEALGKVFGIYNANQSQEALNALVSWNNPAAYEILYAIADSEKVSDIDRKKAFKGYVNMVSGSLLPDDQQLLLLRKIMPIAKDTEEQKMLISSLASVKTFLAFVYVNQFLKHPELKHDAANVLAKIAMPDPGVNNGLSGQIVKEGLSQAMAHITGPDSQYLKIDIETYIANLSGDAGYVSMFNGKDLSGWQGFIANPVKLAGYSSYKKARMQKEADKKMTENWSIKDGCIVFNGKGHNLCSVKEYGDFEMIVDWRITKAGDSGIYLRGTPQVQVWDTSRVEVGAQVGSGGLYNNQKYASKPLLVADNPIGEWNTFYIRMIGERVTVYLNGLLVVDNVVMENYWDRSIPIFPKGPIELQAHGTDLAFRDVYIRELDVSAFNLSEEEKVEGFTSLFNGIDLSGWVGNKTDYQVKNGEISVNPKNGGHGNLFTEKEYADFIYRFDFKLTPGANNGLGIRAPLKGDAAYVGMELQILDNTAPVYAKLKPYQYHGSVYGVIPARRGFLKPVGEWNSEEVIVKGNKIKITLNGVVIVDGDIAEASKNGTMDGKEHPGLKRTKGHIGFLGHGSEVYFRNIRIKEL